MIVRLARIALLTLSLTASMAPACAQVSADADSGHNAWFSYRDLYQAMIRFEKYGKPKQFLQNRLQIVMLDKSQSLDGIQLTLAGKNVRVNLPVDNVGLAVFPLSKSAYDDNAELQVNRPNDTVRLKPANTISPRTDGIYDTADLRTACDQALQFERYINDAGARSKQCTGVRFAFPRDAADAIIKLRMADQRETRLTLVDGSPFDGDATIRVRIATYRFTDSADKTQILINTTPLAITAQFE